MPQWRPLLRHFALAHLPASGALGRARATSPVIRFPAPGASSAVGAVAVLCAAAQQPQPSRAQELLLELSEILFLARRDEDEANLTKAPHRQGRGREKGGTGGSGRI